MTARRAGVRWGGKRGWEALMEPMIGCPGVEPDPARSVVAPGCPSCPVEKPSAELGACIVPTDDEAMDIHGRVPQLLLWPIWICIRIKGDRRCGGAGVPGNPSLAGAKMSHDPPIALGT